MSWGTDRRIRRHAAMAGVQAVKEQPAMMPPWARAGVYLAGGVLLAAGIGMSGFFLSQLAESFNIAAPYSFLLPAALDAGAVVGVLMWVTGTGEIELFGRRLARLLFGLSILGNALERALTFTAAPEGVTGMAAVLTRTVALLEQLSNWEEPTVTVATWFLLAVSVGIGIVFPVLAYQMAHATILARKSKDAPVRVGRAPKAVTRLDGAARLPFWRRRRQGEARQGEAPPSVVSAVSEPGTVGVPAPKRTAVAPSAPVASSPVVPSPVVPSPVGSSASASSSEGPMLVGLIPGTPVPRTPIDTATPIDTVTETELEAEPEPETAPIAVVPALPYVHDSRDLEPGTPQWQDRYDRLPGSSKQAKIAHWLACEWEMGEEPNLARVADRVVNGRRVAQLAKRDLAERGILPPSERARDDVPDLVPVG